MTLKDLPGSALGCGLFLASLFVTACNQGSSTAAVGEAPAGTVDSPDPVPSRAETSGEALTVDQQVAAAVEDLAVQRGLQPGAIRILRASAVTWGSGALGCPQPGRDYTMAAVPGVLLLLEAEGVLYRFHGRKGEALFHCPEDRAQAPAYGPGEEVM